MFRGFIGCGTALVTPFRKDLSLDEEECGSLFAVRSKRELISSFPAARRAKAPRLRTKSTCALSPSRLKRPKVKCRFSPGAGGYNTHHVIEMAREIERLGADGILSVTPYYNKPTQEGLYHHFKAIAAATSLPIILYNVPPRTNVNIDPATLRQLSAIENIIGVKEASGNISQINQVFQQVPENFLVFSGDDAITLPLVAMGGKGVISVASNVIPAEMANFAQLCLAGNFAEARAMAAQVDAVPGS